MRLYRRFADEELFGDLLAFQEFCGTLPILLLAAGVAIAMLGALLPAQWAARSRVTEVLQTE